MARLQLTFREFISQVRMSKSSHILLEGTQDRSFFEILRQALFEGEDRHRSASYVAITTSESIKSEDVTVGNREKVEIISQLVNDTHYSERFIGFVDREYRDFVFSDTIGDNLLRQLISGRLIWSRGHSIENYMLDFDVVRDPLYDCSPNGEIAQTALELLQQNFSVILNAACAIGLAGLKLNQLETVRRTIHWNSLRMNDSILHWDTERWATSLKQHSDLDSQIRSDLVREFEHWFGIARVSDSNIVRWACDGHTAMRLVWAAYSKLVFEVRRSECGIGAKAANQRDSVFRIENNARFNHFARSWARIMSTDYVDTPKVCFDMVGVTSTAP